MFFFFQAEDGIRYLVRSRGLGDVYKRQICDTVFKRVDSSLIKELVKIKQRDEQIREHHTYEEIRTNKKLQDEMVQLDTINMRHIDDILLRYGRYPGKKLVDEMSGVVASVILHLSLIHISEPTRPY